jgi:hypothetical protein
MEPTVELLGPPPMAEAVARAEYEPFTNVKRSQVPLKPVPIPEEQNRDPVECAESVRLELDEHSIDDPELEVLLTWLELMEMIETSLFEARNGTGLEIDTESRRTVTDESAMKTPWWVVVPTTVMGPRGTSSPRQRAWPDAIVSEPTARLHRAMGGLIGRNSMAIGRSSLIVFKKFQITYHLVGISQLQREKPPSTFPILYRETTFSSSGSGMH